MGDMYWLSTPKNLFSICFLCNDAGIEIKRPGGGNQPDLKGITKCFHSMNVGDFLYFLRLKA